MDNQRRYQIIPTLLLIAAVFLLLFNNAYNWHYHHLKDGEIITHAHPHKDNSNQSKPASDHSHKKSEWVILQQISDLLYMALIVGLLLLVLWQSVSRIRSIYIPPVLRYTPVWTKGRDPPVRLY